MKTYVISFSDDDNVGDSRHRFTQKAEAEREFKEIAKTGMFVRLIEWGDNRPTELARENDPNA